MVEKTLIEVKLKHSYFIDLPLFLISTASSTVTVIFSHSYQHGVFIELLQKGFGIFLRQPQANKEGGGFLSKCTFFPNSQWLLHSRVGFPAEGVSFSCCPGKQAHPVILCSANCRCLQAGLLSRIYMGLLSKSIQLHQSRIVLFHN